MAKRKQFEYRVVSYMDDPIRFEQINFGLIIQNIQSKHFEYILTPNDTPKINSLLPTSSKRKLFKLNVNYLRFLLDRLQSEGNYNKLTQTLQDIEIPELIFSSPKPALSDNVSQLLENLADVYIGHQFIARDSVDTTIIEPKVFAEKVVEENDVPKSHYKTNFRVQPERSVPFKIQVDYIYANKDQLEIVNTAPTQLSSTSMWYYRMRSLSDNERFGQKVTILGNTQSEANSDSTLLQMYQTLHNHNSNVYFVDVAQPCAINTFKENVIDVMKSESSESELKKLLA